MRIAPRAAAGTVTALGLLLLAPAAAAEAFRFAWPVPTSVAVRATTVRGDTTSTAHYRLELNAHEAGGLLVSFHDFELLSLNGRDVTTPEARARLGPLAALTAQLPAMHVSGGGAYLGTFGLERMAGRMLELLPGDSDAVQRERLEAYFRAPEVQQMMQQKSGETWNIWVGAWNGLELEAGEQARHTLPVTVMGRPLEQSLLFEHLGAEPATCANCVRLRLTTLMEGPQVVALVSGIARGGDGEGAAGARADFVSARSMNVVEVVTERVRLAPHYARADTEVTLREGSGVDHRRSERKEYWFQWREAPEGAP